VKVEKFSLVAMLLEVGEETGGLLTPGPTATTTPVTSIPGTVRWPGAGGAKVTPTRSPGCIEKPRSAARRPSPRRHQPAA